MEGIDKFMAALVTIPDALIQDIAGEHRKMAEELLARSQPLVPVDTGALKASGRVVKLPDDETSYAVTYGSDEVDYAVPVHEVLWTHHPIGQAKYLEQPTLEMSREFEARIGRRAEMTFKRFEVSASI